MSGLGGRAARAGRAGAVWRCLCGSERGGAAHNAFPHCLASPGDPITHQHLPRWPKTPASCAPPLTPPARHSHHRLRQCPAAHPAAPDDLGALGLVARCSRLVGRGGSATGCVQLVRASSSSTPLMPPMVGEGEVPVKSPWACSMLAEGGGRGYGPVAGVSKARAPLSTKLRLLPARLPRPSLAAIRRRVWVSESQGQDASVQEPRSSAPPPTHRPSLAAGAKLVSRGSALRQGLWSAVRAMRRHPEAALGAVRAITRRHKWPPQPTTNAATPAVSHSAWQRRRPRHQTKRRAQCGPHAGHPQDECPAVHRRPRLCGAR